MPRRGPINPEGIYHVSTRGNFGEPLFLNGDQHALYLKLYTASAQKFGWITLDWTLLWNHHHFLIRLTNGGLSEGMQKVNHAFSRRMNAIYGRTGKGHLVRHCFYAGEIESEEQLLTACRYIDLNPVAGEAVQEPGRLALGRLPSPRRARLRRALSRRIRAADTVRKDAVGGPPGLSAPRPLWTRPGRP